MAVLLVAAYTQDARVTLRNAVAAHDETVIRRFGRAVLLRETMFGAFLACRLRAEHGTAVQVERTAPFLDGTAVPERVRKAADAYADREARTTPYRAFAAGTSHPDLSEMKDTEL